MDGFVYVNEATECMHDECHRLSANRLLPCCEACPGGVHEGHCDAMEVRRKEGPVICLVIDRSGSTEQMMPEIVGGVNAFISEQKEVGNAQLRVIRFDHSVEFVYTGTLSESPVFTEDDFKPRGMTALRDALGTAISHIDSIVPSGFIHSSIGVTIVIFTDGDENASRHFSAASLKEMVKHRQTMGWDINLIGAGIDSLLSGESLGVASDRCQTYSRGEAAVGLRTASASVTRARTNGV